MGSFYRDEEFIKCVGGNIKRILNRKGITHIEFNIATGLLVSRICSGDMNMTISTLKLIADHLNIEVWELIKQ